MLEPNAESLARTRAIVARVAAEVLRTDTLTPMRNAIRDLVEREGTPTLAAVSRLPGAAGHKTLTITGTNVVLFGGLSWDAISALTELQIERLVRLAPTAPLVYALEGIVPALPIAEPGRSYVRDHWLPVVLVAT